MIPRLIHQTAPTLDLPEACRPYREKLFRLHPDWTYRLWNDDDNLTLVREGLPQFLDVFTALPRNIMRADVIRYVYMYLLGGLYLDTDYEMLRPFDMVDRQIVLPRECDGDSGEPERIGNSLFASVPGHRFWKLVLDDLMSHPPLAPDVDVLAATGPLFLTRMLVAARARGIDVYTPQAFLFNPPTPRNDREYRAIIKDDQAYGIHHCFGSWREYGIVERFKMSVGRFFRRLM